MAAPTVETVTLQEDKYRANIMVNILPDGDADVSDETIVDASTLTVGNTPTDLKIISINWSIDGFTAKLEWDATTDTTAIVLAPGGAGELHERKGLAGGITNDAGSGKTGDILLNTSGLTANGEGGFIIIGVKKIY